VCQDACLTNNNTVQGDDALISLTTGFNNTATGFQALFSNTEGYENTANGYNALYSNTTSINNTAIGSGALLNNTSDNNTAVGYQALYSNTSSIHPTDEPNTAVGSQALFANTTGWANTATGSYALYSNMDGKLNTANGDYALYSNTHGSRNIGTGYAALGVMTDGGHNVGFGNSTCGNMTTGNYNTAIGYSAGWDLTAGDNNVIINNVGVATESNTIRIGSQVAGIGADGSTQPAHTAAFVAGIYQVTVARGLPVVIDSNGHLGTKGSSERFKEDIKPMDKASEAILALKPVTFHYKKELDAEGILQFGLVAEQVEKINPDLVARDEQGKPYTVRYEAVNAMLLNEFLKEHCKGEQQDRKIEKLEATIAKQQKQIEALATGLQKVSDQLELSKPAPQVVNNP
jgi:hypothetical protein